MAKAKAEGKAAFQDSPLLTPDDSYSSSGKQLPNQPGPNCPQCGSAKIYRDGFRMRADGTPVQRFICRICGLRFSERAPAESSRPLQNCPRWQINRANPLVSSRQVCDLLTEGSTNLATVEKEKLPDSTIDTQTRQNLTINGKLVSTAFYMQKQGYAPETVRGHIGALNALIRRNADLMDPESVKAALAQEKKWSQCRRRNVINAYTLFLKVNGGRWEKPKCRVTRKFPFIPTEQEINSLISGCGTKTATFLQLLKETAMRAGEAKRLEWINIDFEKNLVTLNDPEKGSNPRIWKVSPTLTGMLNMLPKKSAKIFGDGSVNSMKSTFTKARRRLAAKLQNPRLLQISFHTLRHWKATMLYHKTKDANYVKQFLGHKCMSNTEIYINIEHTLFEEQSDDEFTVKVAEKPEDIKALLEAGFEYVCQKDGLIYTRKRK